MGIEPRKVSPKRKPEENDNSSLGVSSLNNSILIAGVDEVGRGPLCGPVVTAAAVFPESFTHAEITDSKKLSKKKRELLYDEVLRSATDWAIVSLGPRVIDKLNILQATLYGMSLAVANVKADRVLVDGNKPIECELPQECVIGGDAKHVHIGAASILAKVWRDRLMQKLDEEFPGYGLGGHAGYPTKAHKAAVEELGPSPMHRASFRGVKEFWSEELESAYIEDTAEIPGAASTFILSKNRGGISHSQTNPLETQASPAA